MIGLLYAIFFLKEIKVPKVSEPNPDEIAQSAEGTQTNGSSTSGVVNMGFQDAPSGNENAGDKVKNSQSNGNHPQDNPDEVVAEKKNICRDFFDPTLALACIKVVKKKREHLMHIIIWFLIVSYIIIAGTAQGKFLLFFL